MGRLTGLCLVTLGLAWPTQASPAADVRLRLLGAWSVDCGAALQEGKALVVYFQASDKDPLWMVVVTRNGDLLNPSSTKMSINSALQGGRAKVDFDHGAGEVNHTTLMFDSDREFHVEETIDRNGLVTTSRGVRRSTGEPSLRYHKCSLPTADSEAHR
jgi:hypothetical protein